MLRFNSAAERARRDADASYERCRKAAASSAGAVSSALSVISGGGSALGKIESMSRSQLANAAEQVGHFRGQTFTSVRPIAQTIAGQAIRLAKISKNVKGKRQRIVETRRYDRRALESFVVNRLGIWPKSDEQLEVVDQHPILDAINHPCPSVPGTTKWHLLYNLAVSMELTGRGYWWFVKTNGKKEIWTLPTPWCRPEPSANDLFAGWVIRAEGVTDEVKVPKEDVAQFWYPDPRNPLRAYGPLEAGSQGIFVDEYVQTAIKNTFQLGPHPSVIVTMGSKLNSSGKKVRPWATEAQMNEFREAFNRRYRGMLHYGEALFKDAKIEDIQPFGNKPKDMDFGMNADKSQARVEQTFGTNPYMVGAASLGSRAEAAEAHKNFAKITVNPKIELISLTMTGCVLPQYDTSGQYILFVEPYHPDDEELEQKEWELLAKGRAFTVNEARSRSGLPSVPWGEERFTPLTTTNKPDEGPDVDVPAASGGGKPPAQPVESDAEEVFDGENEGDGDEGSVAPGKSFKSTKVYDEAFYKDFSDVWLKTHGEHETSLKTAVLAFLKEQGDDVAAKLEENYGKLKSSRLRTTLTAKAAADAVFKPAEWNSKLKAAVTPGLTYSWVSGAAMELAAFGESTALALPDDAPEAAGKSRKDTPVDLGFEFGVDLPDDVKAGIEAGLTDSLNQDYWNDINVTTLDRLQTVLQDGLTAGMTLKELVHEVRENVFEGEIGRDRAETIARTEVTGALNAGQQEGRVHLEREGIIEGKEWSSAHDMKTRPTHVDADGEVVGVNEMFTVGGEQAMYPGDFRLSAKERVHCRCVGVSRTKFSGRASQSHIKMPQSHCEVHG